jgi:DeoR/GlpR family transcriptional regulator of sugar metabolism
MPITKEGLERDSWYPVGEVAKRLDKSDQTIRRYINNYRSLRATKKSDGRWYVKGSQLIAFIDSTLIEE